MPRPTASDPLDRLDDLLPVYAELLAALRAAGAEWVQLDEPALVSESLPRTADAALADAATARTPCSASSTDRPAILVAAPYAQLSAAAWTALAAAPVEALAIDLARGSVPAPAAGLEDKTLVGGVIDGRNVWRGDLGRGVVDRSTRCATSARPRVAVATSTSLQHVPHDVADEPDLDPRLVSWLAFADQKVGQVVTLARGLAEGRDAIDVRARRGIRRPGRSAQRARRARRRRAVARGRAHDRATSPAATTRSRRDGAAGRARAAGCCRPRRSGRSRRPPTSAAPARSMRAGELSTARVRGVPARRDRAGHRPAGGARSRRARARRARAQRHGAVLRREPRRLRRDPQRLGAVLRLARHASVDPLGRRLPARADHGGLVGVRAVADRAARQGHADRARSRSSRGRSCATTSRWARPPTRSPSRCATRSPTSRRPASASSRSTSPRCASCCR